MESFTLVTAICGAEALSNAAYLKLSIGWGNHR
jgi:hypothetical protein